MVTYRALAAVCLTAMLTACAGVSDVVVKVPPHIAAAGSSALATPAPVTVAVNLPGEVRGTGVLPGRIGERKTIGDLSMGLVSVDPPPGEIVRQALAAELRAAGQHVATAGAAASIDGMVQQFEIRTDATALYWDVIGTTAVSVTVRKGMHGATGHYAASCRERTYVWPTSELMAHVLANCIDEIGRQFRNDGTIGQLLAG